MRSRFATLLISFVVVVGCGGVPDDGQGARQPTQADGLDGAKALDALTRAEFVRRADAKCRKWEDRPPSAADFERIDGLRTTDLGGYLSRAGELYARDEDNLRARNDELGDLPPPQGDESQVKAFLQETEEQASLTGSLAGAATRGDEQAVTELFEEAERQAQRLGGVADGYGFKDC